MQMPDFCIPLSFSWALYGLTPDLNMTLCGRHFENLDAIIKERKVAQIWITHSLRHEYSQRQRDWKGTRVGESHFETEYFVPGFSFSLISRTKWLCRDLTGINNYGLFHSLFFIPPHWIPTHLQWLCEGRDCNSSSRSSEACYIYATLNMIQQQSLLLKHCLCCIRTENIEYDKEA